MYDMDELEIQKKILLDITSREFKEEKDKWHRKYNDAEIEISHLKREVDSLISAVKTLIKERDSFIPVRCKECKYWENKENAVWCRRTAIGIFRMEEEDFCSKGEKR